MQNRRNFVNVRINANRKYICVVVFYCVLLISYQNLSKSWCTYDLDAFTLDLQKHNMIYNDSVFVFRVKELLYMNLQLKVNYIKRKYSQFKTLKDVVFCVREWQEEISA